jgi:hypothetical protein
VYNQEVRIRFIGATAAARDLLPPDQGRGMAVLNNVPLGGRNADPLPLVTGKKLPDSVAGFGAATYAQFSLKYNLSHPAITGSSGTQRTDLSAAFSVYALTRAAAVRRRS